MFCTPRITQKHSLNHGRQTSRRPGQHRPFICFQAGSGAPKPGAAPLSPSMVPTCSQHETSFFWFVFSKCHFFFVTPAKSWLPTRPRRAVRLPLRHVARLGRKKERSFLIYPPGPLHIRRPVSAASRAPSPLPARSAMPETIEKTSAERLLLQIPVTNFVFKARP